MTKSLPAYERALHEQFKSIYDELSDLKNNRSHYINSKQVYQIYDKFLNIVHELTLTRKDEELKGITLSLPNTNDLLIDDTWQLLSLCFVTCGLIKFAPATYSSLATVSKLLEHLKECQVYTMDDLRPIKSRLEEIKDIISNSGSDDDGESNVHKLEESLLLMNKLNKCQSLYKDLEKNFENVPSDLVPIYMELISLRKSLLNYLTDPTINSPNSQFPKRLEEIRAKIKTIGSKRDEEGKFVSKIGTEEQLRSTQVVLNGLFDDCNYLIRDLSIQKDTDNLSDLFDSMALKDHGQATTIQNFKRLYEQLIDLKLKLENLLVTRRWTMRETDLYNYQKLLKQIDDERIALIKDIDPNNKDIKRLQILILYLLRRCYGLIYKLLESSEPVSESLQPIHNQLSTVRRCLLELKRIDGLNNLRDLYPFQFKLASLDNLRKDGKFIVNNQIPEGQATLNALLAECFDIIHELKIELEEKEEERQKSPEKQDSGDGTDSEDINSDDEVELKRNRYAGLNEADYDQASESESDYDDDSCLSDSEYEGNDYY
ncbi:uncharacterized protein PRCAT00002583001 [Priceomyces carsonii]|uniref:uncharacterized protein n=1 Tax=Priceomyces carsonii TaxID=28549 RepID=UPI002EDB3E30|nr:unnamed protein product [Priceomyces carsonii]